jgi:hypothetical protein
MAMSPPGHGGEPRDEPAPAPHESVGRDLIRKLHDLNPGPQVQDLGPSPEQPLMSRKGDPINSARRAPVGLARDHARRAAGDTCPTHPEK